MSQQLANLAIRLLLPVVILVAGGYGYTKLAVPIEEEVPEAKEAKKIRSRVQSLFPGEYAIQIETNGIVGPHNRVTLSAEVTGRIESTKSEFEVGSYFTAGDVLLEIDDRDYQTALRIAKENHRLAKSTLKLAETAYQRMRELVRRNSGSKSELDTALATLVQGESQLEITDASIDQAQRDLERTKIIAPFDGRVVSRAIGVGTGQLVSPGAVLGEIFAVDYAEVRLPIAGRELNYLDLPEMEGDPTVEVQLRDSVDPNNPTVWTARIVRTEGTLDANSLELFAIARVDDPFGLVNDHPILRIGQPVTATIRGRTLQDVVTLPRDSVRRMDQVHLVDPSSMELRSITINPLWSDADSIVVRSSEIQPGDYLATTMLVYAPEGAIVEIIPNITGEVLVGAPAAQDETP